jgi:hypothetical protein
MSLAQVLSKPASAPDLLLRPAVLAHEGQAALVRDVLAAANADAGLPIRHVIYGAEARNGRLNIVGLDRDALLRLRELVKGLAKLVEPAIEITPEYAKSNGRFLAALHVSGCDNPPYTLRQRVSDDMRTGACWVQADGSLRPARRVDLDRIYARRAGPQPMQVELGLNDDPTCRQALLPIPDSSQPPSQRERAKLTAAIDAKKAAATLLNGEDTALARLDHARIFGADTPYVARGIDTLVMQFNQVTDEYSEADKHYYYEQQAVKLNFSIRNEQASSLQDLEVGLKLPQARGFSVADRLYSDAKGGHTAMESRLAGYPEVDKKGGHACVRVKVGTLRPGVQQSLLETALRIHVGPEMRGQEVGITYQITAQGLDSPLTGRLKLVFATSPSPPQR